MTSWRLEPRLIALFDVLGFSALIDQHGAAEILRRFGLIKKKLDDLFKWEARAVTFSDTIFVFSPSRRLPLPDTEPDPWRMDAARRHMEVFLKFCGSLVADALLLEMPLRGAIAFGPCAVLPTRGIFVGEPIVWAYRLEQMQDWIGAALHSSCLHLVYDTDDPSYVVAKYPIPFKGDAGNPDGWALDWPRMARHPIRVRERVSAMAANHAGTQHAQRWENTHRFVEERFSVLQHGPRDARRLVFGELPARFAWPPYPTAESD